jgi:hypothetical protein
MMGRFLINDERAMHELDMFTRNTGHLWLTGRKAILEQGLTMKAMREFAKTAARAYAKEIEGRPSLWDYLFSEETRETLARRWFAEWRRRKS